MGKGGKGKGSGNSKGGGRGRSFDEDTISVWICGKCSAWTHSDRTTCYRCSAAFQSWARKQHN
eukprot:14757592-Alexandrium_andersonii.AAC.1